MPALGTLLARSLALLRAHPVVLPSLGLAVLLSMASMGFGIGFLITPWFICEIFGVQLSILTRVPTQRTGAWVRAGIMVLGLVGMVVATTFLAALALGPDVSTADHAAAPLPWPEALRRVGMITGVTLLATGFFAPFAYAPLILIERGGSIGAAALESAWLVRRGGLLRHWALAFLAQLLPLAPALIAAVVVGRTFERAATPLGVLLGLPLLPFSIPLGQGLLSAAYAERKRELSQPRWTRADGRPPRGLVAVFIALTLGPALSLLCLVFTTLRPTPPSPGHGPGYVEMTMILDPPGAPRRQVVPTTTLEVAVDGRDVTITAGDGGGVGRIPRRWPSPVERVVVRRHRDIYPVEIHAGSDVFVVTVDRAAARVDDSVGSRLDARLPPFAIPAIALAFALSSFLMVRALARWGEVRRAYAEPASAMPDLETLRALRADALRTGWRTAAVLSPFTVVALVGGALALLR